MEVHQHTHTPRKKWSHYFWEFFMLFLAVFCGFLAENQREHLVEHRREKQYMRTMVQDIQRDISSMESIINNFKQQLLSFDTVIAEFPNLKTGFSAPFARNLFPILWYEDLVPNDRTLQQLKNAGGMRLIRKIDVSDSIMEYDRRMKDLLIEQGALEFCSKQYRDIGELLKIELFSTMFSPGKMKQHEKENTMLLVTNDPSVFSRYLGYILLHGEQVRYYIELLKDISSYGSRLINLISNEYHLK